MYGTERKYYIFNLHLWPDLGSQNLTRKLQYQVLHPPLSTRVKMEKSPPPQFEEMENVKTNDLIRNGGILLDIEGRDISLKTAKDGHVSPLRSEKFQEPRGNLD